MIVELVELEGQKGEREGEIPLLLILDFLKLLFLIEEKLLSLSPEGREIKVSVVLKMEFLEVPVVVELGGQKGGRGGGSEQLLLLEFL